MRIYTINYIIIIIFIILLLTLLQPCSLLSRQSWLTSAVVIIQLSGDPILYAAG